MNALLPLLLALHSAPAPQSVLVWAVEVPDALSPSSPVLTDALTESVRRSSEFPRVHSRQDLVELLEKAPREELFACPECVEAVQRALKVDLLLATRVSFVDGRLAVTMKLMDLRTAEVLASVTEVQPDAQLVPLMERLPVLFARVMLETHLREMVQTVLPPDDEPGS